MRLEPFATLNEMRKEYGIRKTILIKVDESVERFTAGLRINDLRGILRGDPPGKPNPRVKPHTEGAWFHIWPSFYHQAVTKFYPTFKLGMITTIFFIIEIITGLFLMLYYTPAPVISYDNMLRILSNVPLGQFVRDIHRLAAEGMVIAVWLHMGRTFLTGSYKKPRQFTWATGVILLLLTIGLSYSGYLLPWDQLAYWAVTIGASMADAAPPPEVGKAVGLLLRGAPDLGAGGLLRFYLLHVFAFPLIAIIFVFVHYYKVIRFGHSLPPEMENIGEDNARKVPPDKRVPFLPDIFTNELLWFVFILAALIVPIALNVYHAPLEHAANPQSTPLHTVAPWYFLFLQGWLKLGDKTFWGVIFPTILIGLLLLWPYIDYNPSRRYGDRKLALMAMVMVIGFLVVSSYMGTPGYGVVTAPQIEVGFNALPPEKPGPIRSLPFDQLMVGSWDTYSLSSIPDNAPQLKAVMTDIKNEIDAEPKSIVSNGVQVNYTSMHAVLTVEVMQSDASGPTLKHLTLVVHWDGEPIDPVRGQPGYYLDTFVHKDSNYVAGGE
ncbi:MAG TPA: cytochrome bc complex cytochrome b subunit [Anaerolineae bacterium]|nr:cytochrome bc complex cytochrome b subunit [Anaerolineae bacterium]